jgi:hypothetical protein
MTKSLRTTAQAAAANFPHRLSSLFDLTSFSHASQSLLTLARGVNHKFLICFALRRHPNAFIQSLRI